MAKDEDKPWTLTHAYVPSAAHMGDCAVCGHLQEALIHERQEFSVCQFFINGTYEYVRRYVGAKEAVEAAAHYTNSVAVRMGIVERVIITDGGDFTVFEWKAGQGVTFPPQQGK
jgi:hypothetical protein